MKNKMLDFYKGAFISLVASLTIISCASTNVKEGDAVEKVEAVKEKKYYAPLTNDSTTNEWFAKANESEDTTKIINKSTAAIATLAVAITESDKLKEGGFADRIKAAAKMKAAHFAAEKASNFIRGQLVDVTGGEEILSKAKPVYNSPQELAANLYAHHVLKTKHIGKAKSVTQIVYPEIKDIYPKISKEIADGTANANVMTAYNNVLNRINTANEEGDDFGEEPENVTIAAKGDTAPVARSSSTINEDDMGTVNNSSSVNENGMGTVIQYGFDKHSLNNEYADLIDEQIANLTKDENLRVTITGYADETGPEEYNLKLSELRANTIAEKIINSGISSDRVSAKGLGEKDPVASNDTREGRSKNRRTVIIIE